ncbi:MAG TPA: hypothetical protein ENI77_00110, partial [Nitrospirae bacterium]|nr:hypothetical protein [Nitrospirota bacterium]
MKSIATYPSSQIQSSSLRGVKDSLVFAPFSVTAWLSAFRQGGGLSFSLFFLLIGTLSVERGGWTAADRLSVGMGLAQGTRGVFLALAILFALSAIKQFRWSNLSIGRWLLAYTVFCLLSTLWSYNHLMTLGKSTELFVAAWIFMAAASSKRPLGRLNALLSITL